MSIDIKNKIYSFNKYFYELEIYFLKLLLPVNLQNKSQEEVSLIKHILQYVYLLKGNIILVLVSKINSPILKNIYVKEKLEKVLCNAILKKMDNVDKKIYFLQPLVDNLISLREKEIEIIINFLVIPEHNFYTDFSDIDKTCLSDIKKYSYRLQIILLYKKLFFEKSKESKEIVNILQLKLISFGIFGSKILDMDGFDFFNETVESFKLTLRLPELIKQTISDIIRWNVMIYSCSNITKEDDKIINWKEREKNDSMEYILF